MSKMPAVLACGVHGKLKKAYHPYTDDMPCNPTFIMRTVECEQPYRGRLIVNGSKWHDFIALLKKASPAGLLQYSIDKDLDDGCVDENLSY